MLDNDARPNRYKALTKTLLATLSVFVVESSIAQDRMLEYSIDWPVRQPRFLALEAGGWLPPLGTSAPEIIMEEHSSWFAPSPLGPLSGLSSPLTKSDPPNATGSTVTSAGAEPTAKKNKHGRLVGRGRAVWYELPGNTASGERYDPSGFTAGHRTLPFGTKVLVVNEQNGRSAVVRINDRGPVKKRFVIDLSQGTAKFLGISGTAPVALFLVEEPPNLEVSAKQSSR